MLPLAAPGLAAIAAFSFLFSYSELLFALFTTETPHAKTIPVIIASVSVNPDASYTLIAVGIVLSMIAPDRVRARLPPLHHVGAGGVADERVGIETWPTSASPK